VENLARRTADLLDHFRRVAAIMPPQNLIDAALIPQRRIAVHRRTDQPADEFREVLWLARRRVARRFGLVSPRAIVVTPGHWVEAGENAVGILGVAEIAGDDGGRVGVPRQIIVEKTFARRALGGRLLLDALMLLEHVPDQSAEEYDVAARSHRRVDVRH